MLTVFLEGEESYQMTVANLSGTEMLIVERERKGYFT